MRKKTSVNTVPIWQNQIVVLLPDTFSRKIEQENAGGSFIEEQLWVDEKEKSILTVRVNEIEEIQELSDDMFYNLYFHRLKREIESFVYLDGFRRMYQGRELFAIQYEGEVNGIKSSYLTVFYKSDRMNYNMTFECARENWRKSKKTFANILNTIRWV